MSILLAIALIVAGFLALFSAIGVGIAVGKRDNKEFATGAIAVVVHIILCLLIFFGGRS